MDRIAVVLLAVGLWAATGGSSSLQAETGTPSPAWHYQLIEGSTLVVDCPICDGPTLLQPLRGSFTVRLLEENPILARYALENIEWTTGSLPGGYTATGSGVWQIGGEVALLQTMTLDLEVNGQKIQMTNTSSLVARPWPMMEIPLSQNPPTSIQLLLLNLDAAPFRELWFSTASGFTPADSNRPRGSGGDLLSSTGRVVRSNRELIAPFAFSPENQEHRVDALDIGPGGEVLFSLDETAFSESLGAIQHGDLISDRGRRLLLNQQLLEPFGLVFDALDLGLDAVTLRDDGEVLFSITTNRNSPNAGPLDRGDLLSSRGFKLRDHAQLLSRFQPDADVDFGLDAVFVWPHGEIWFSTEDGFVDRNLGYVQAGDILSDQGYVVIRNLDLLAPYQPIEDLADFGLDGLFVLSDYVPTRRRPHLELPELTLDSSSWHFQWRGEGRVFQLESTAPGTFSWHPASPLLPAAEALIPIKASTPSTALFRLRQW